MVDSVLDGPERPLYEIKANLFKALAHPARIRVLEILSTSEGPTVVSDILAASDIEPTLLSQHLAVVGHVIPQGLLSRNSPGVGLVLVLPVGAGVV